MGVEANVHLIDFGPEHAAPIAEYASRGAGALSLADGTGEAHVYAVHLDAGGEIGPHPAGYGQLWLVVAGEGWAAGADGVRHPVRAGMGAVFARASCTRREARAGAQRS